MTVYNRDHAKTLVLAGLLMGAPASLLAVPNGQTDDVVGYGLDTIIITGSRHAESLADSVIEVDVIDADTIARSGAANVSEVLQQSAAVKITPNSALGPGVEIQGFDSEHVLILVNGRRVNGQVEGAVDLRRINTSNIRQIEVVRGPSSALYGSDALGGVINIITETDNAGSELTLRADDIGSYEISGQLGHYMSDTVRTTLAAGHQFTHSFDLDESNSGNDGPENERYFIDGNLAWEMGADSTLRVEGFYQQQDRLVNQNTTGGATVDYRNMIEEWRVTASPEWQIGQANVSVNLGFSRYHDQFVQDIHGTSNGDADETTRDDLITWGAQVNTPIGDAHELTAGLDNQIEKLQSERLSQDAERTRIGAFLQDKITGLLDDNLSITVGGRFDADTQFGSRFTPKLGAKYQLQDSWELRAGFGGGYRAPDFKQLYLRFVNGSQGYVVNGNPDLLPEESSSVNVGLAYSGSSFRWSSNAYYNDVKNLIEIIEVTSGAGLREFSYRNVSRAELWGIDNQVNIAATDNLDLRAFYNYLNATDKDSGEQLSGRAKHRLGFGVVWDVLDHWQASADVNWVGKRNFVNDLGRPGGANGEAEPYTQIDLRLGWAKGAWDVAGGVKNLLDEGDTEFLPLTPRRLYLELKRSF